MKRTFLLASLIASLLFSTSGMAYAETEADPLAALQAQIATLLSQVESLQTQLEEARQQRGELQAELTQVRSEFRAYLRIGVESDEVTSLQELLAEDSSIYPEGLVTGYFGPLTAKAVKKFQKKYGIEQVGVVGPQTRAQLNALLEKKWGEGPYGQTKKIKVTVNTGNKSDDDDDENEDEDEYEYDDDLEEGTYFVGTGMNKVALCHKGKTIVVALPAMWAHTKHGDSIGACGVARTDDDDDDDDDDDGDDVDELDISSVSVSNITDTGAKISWSTNLNADSKVLYDTELPVNDESDAATSSILVKEHMFTLTGLSPETKYYYMVVSVTTDGEGATSSVRAFTTAAESDDDAPVLSEIEATSTDTTITVSWTTNEDADSFVRYSTDLPLESTDSYQELTALVTDHEVELTGLSPETMYYYSVTSEDGAGNAQTSGVYQIETLATPADETAPDITGVGTTNVASTSADIAWTTNEDATSLVWYATSSPVDTGSADSVSDTTLVQSHSLSLEDLATSTTYHFVVVSEDAVGNTSTSTGYSFTTLSE